MRENNDQTDSPVSDAKEIRAYYIHHFLITNRTTQRRSFTNSICATVYSHTVTQNVFLKNITLHQSDTIQLNKHLVAVPMRQKFFMLFAVSVSVSVSVLYLFLFFSHSSDWQLAVGSAFIIMFRFLAFYRSTVFVVS